MSNDRPAVTNAPEAPYPDVVTPAGGVVPHYEGDDPRTEVVVDAIRRHMHGLPADAYPEIHVCQEALYAGVPWFCTRMDDHAGRHIASGIVTVCAAWPGDHLPTLDDLSVVAQVTS